MKKNVRPDGDISSIKNPSSVSPENTRVFSVPSKDKACAIFSAKSGENTPITCLFTPTGFVIGPKRLKIVLIPSSFLIGATFFIAGWNFGAKRKTKFFSLSSLSTSSGSTFIFTPNFSRISAEPSFEETALFPCFATFIPSAAKIIADAVEALNV